MSSRDKVKSVLVFFVRVDVLLLGIGICISIAVLGVTLPAMFVYYNTGSAFLAVGTMLAITFLFLAPWIYASLRILTWAINIYKALGGTPDVLEDIFPRT